MNLMATIKENPIPIGIGALLILVFAMRGKSGGDSGASSLVGASLQSQAMANDANVKLSSINAQAATARSSFIADMYKTGIGAKVAIDNKRAETDAGSLLGMLNHLDNKQSVAAELELGLRSMQASQEIAAKTLDTKLALTRDDNATKLNAIAQSLQPKMAELNYQYTLADKQMDATQSMFTLGLQHQQTMMNTGFEHQKTMFGMDINDRHVMRAAEIKSEEYLSRILKQPLVEAQAKAIRKSSSFGFDDLLNAAPKVLDLGGSIFGSISSMFGGGDVEAATSGAVSSPAVKWI